MHLRNKQRITLKYLLSPILVLAVATTQAQSAGAPHIRYTPDQYTEFEKMMSHRRAGGTGFRGSRTI